MNKQLTVIIERDGDGYVSLCPELDIASQGDSIEEARNNLKEAVELFFETASDSATPSESAVEIESETPGPAQRPVPGDKIRMQAMRPA